ncbi:SRPBCC domain-containing protein [Natronoglycomyces albus]|uniref:SRPBCC domain-containing protein n=1 Tax=Natronoglycomyces albus TaxID=2811108 RepID=A0A895XU96_9ACTN|nr:SRPBCC domain-containing protein [Natronoglycomyces albus]QSB05228.1 SRPBCC domain-containing protein [Natronoglycomyces albus]
MDFTFKVPPGQPILEWDIVVDAPMAVAFAAYMDAAEIPSFWGPAIYATEVLEFDPHTGGKFRIVSRADDGTEHLFSGVFHEVIPGERIVSTFQYGPSPAPVNLEIHDLSEVDGRARFAGRTIFESTQMRDEWVEGGCEEGMHETFTRFERVLARRLGDE